MLKKLKRPGRRIFTALGIVMMLAAGCIGFTGCKADAEENTRLEDLEFTVAAENEVPAQLKELISQKRETSGSDLSYPVLIVKTQYREEPVVFQ